MRAFIHASCRYALVCMGLAITLGLSLYAGAVIGNWLCDAPELGAVFGAAAYGVALVFRARIRVTRADIYRAALYDESPYVMLPVMVLIVFYCMGMGGALAAGAAQLIDPTQTIDATIFGGALGLGWALYCAIVMPQGEEPDHEDIHGDARPATLAEALEHGALSLDWEQGLFVGEWREPYKNRFGQTRYKSYLLSTCTEMSGLVIAPPGAGKFVCAVGSTALANCKDHVFFHDPKGEIVQVAAAGLRARGYHVEILDHVNTLGGKLGTSAQINPLGDLYPASGDLYDPSWDIEAKVDVLVFIVITKSEGEKNPFFAITARQLFAALCLILLEREGKNASLPMAVELLNESPEILNKAALMMKTWSKFPTVKYVGNQWHLPMKNKTELEKRNEGMDSVLATAKSETQWLASGAMHRMFSASTFSFKNMKRTDEKWAVFNVCPEANAKATEKANKLIFSAAKNDLACEPKVPVLMVIDEMCTAMDSSAAPLIQDLFNIGRGAGVRVIGVVQSWPQMVAWAGGDEQAEALSAAAGAVIYYGANDLMTAKHIREEVGNFTMWEPSTNPAAAAGVEGGTRPIAQPLLRDSDLRAMLKDGRQVIMLNGVAQPVIMPRTPYFKIPVLNARAQENPYYKKGK